ncbi:hypothetical protein [Kocuria palustris]|uniref:DUF6414 family protein n=1 Tax=Kocuria palustris TaxID=71999 RepID=UPI000B2FBB43|nr:hypothetical protein [Kocuria palustris]
MFLRDYLYVDIDKVHGLATQIYDGVPEKSSDLAARQSELGVDLKLLKGSRGKSKQEVIDKSLGDAVFQDLESDLESLNFLSDISHEISTPQGWDELHERLQPGQIVRITAPATLFHPTHLSTTILNLATAADGIHQVMESFESDREPAQSVAPTAKKKNRNDTARRGGPTTPPDPSLPETQLPNIETIPYLDAPRELLAGMIRATRGIFGDGIHLHMRPTGTTGPIISARLEEGRRFFDSQPDVLLSRYGLVPQEFTLVGILGQLGSNLASTEDANMSKSDNALIRAGFVDMIAKFLGESAGLVDMPADPGFSITPLAVYRGILG